MTHNFEDLKKRMDGAINALKHSLNGLRTGRASTALLEPIKVDAYGNYTPINQVGTISVPEPKLIVVQVWDSSLVRATEKAIQDAGLGLNPISDGQVIRVPLPDLSEQRRKELCKKAHEYSEQAKISVRNIRRDGMDELKKLEKDKELSEDESKSKSDELQKITDEFIKKIDATVVDKEKEIMQV